MCFAYGRSLAPVRESFDVVALRDGWCGCSDELACGWPMKKVSHARKNDLSSPPIDMGGIG